MAWFSDKVGRQLENNDLGRRERYRAEVIDTLRFSGYTRLDADDARLQEVINSYYNEGIAPAGVPYYLGKYGEKEDIIDWGADWASIQRQYFRED